MIATENAQGDLEFKIAGALYDILVEHVGGPVDATLCYFLEHLPLRDIARLESLASAIPTWRTTTCAASSAGNESRLAS